MVKNLLKACFMMAALVAAGQAAAETYTVGSGGTYRPFEFENSQKQLEGFDIDIIKAIARAEGFDVKLVNTPGRAFSPLWVPAIATLSSRVLPSPINANRWWISPRRTSRPSSRLWCRKVQK